MLPKRDWKLVVQREIDAPGEEEIVEGAHRMQAVVVVKAGGHQSAVAVGAGAVAAMEREP
jgi:hypothetical protein